MIPLLLLLGVLLGGCSGSDPEAGADGGGFVFRVPVTWALVEAGVVAQTVELVGDVRSRRWAELAFERGGRIAAVHADLGDERPAGTVLARLDDSVLLQELAAARARLEFARSEAEWAEREVGRAREAGPSVISAAEQDRRDSALVAQRARLAEAEAEAARLTALLAQGELRAPFDGVVVARAVSLGSHAAPGVPAFTFVDLEHREVHLELPAEVAAAVTVGTQVTLREGGIVARLDEVVPAADLSTRTFIGIVRLDGLDPERRLLPGLFVHASFERNRVESETVVPRDAVLTTPQGSHVVMFEWLPPPGEPTGTSARLVPVRVLARDATRAAVSTFEPGLLRPGLAVAVTGADNAFPDALLLPTPVLPPEAAPPKPPPPPPAAGGDSSHVEH
ncbi:MAG: efflux RND transporter periplasmic adaptor subunit [Planctomycetota bacterium]